MAGLACLVRVGLRGLEVAVLEAVVVVLGLRSRVPNFLARVSLKQKNYNFNNNMIIIIVINFNNKNNLLL